MCSTHFGNRAPMPSIAFGSVGFVRKKYLARYWSSSKWARNISHEKQKSEQTNFSRFFTLVLLFEQMAFCCSLILLLPLQFTVMYQFIGAKES